MERLRDPGRAGRAERGPERLPRGRGSPGRRRRAHRQHLDGHPRRPGRSPASLGAQQAFNTEPIDEPEIARGRPILGSVEQVAARLREYKDAGFPTAIVELPAPYDLETIERLIGEVKPLVDAD